MAYGITCYVLSLALVLAFSAFYLFRPSFMPYHGDAVQRPWHDVDSRMQLLLLALMRALGMAWLSWLLISAFLLLLLLSKPVIFWQLATFQLLYLLAAIAPVVVAMRLRRQTGARTPVVSGALAALLSVLGFACITLS